MLADSWKMIRIKDVCELGRGRVINQDELYDHPGQYPVYSSQSKDSGAFGCLDTFDFDGEYVTWTTDGAYAGTVFYRSGRFNCTNVCGTLKAKTNEICMKYLSFGLSTKSKNHVSYVGNPKLMNNIMGNIVIPFPPLPEQRRIAEILDTIDEAIQKTEALISKLKAMKQGLLHDLLTRGLDKNGKLRDPKAHPEQFKDSPLGRIPKEWKVDKLGEVCRRSGGSVQTGPFGSQLHASDYKDSGTPIITVEHLGDNQIIYNNLPLVGRMDYERLERYRIETGDLVFSRVGAIDRCAYVSEQENGWLFSGRCLRVRTGGKFVNSRFLSFQLNSHGSRKWILNHSVGSTMACLNTSILSEVPVLLPLIQEQENMVLLLDAHDARIRSEEQYRDKLKLQKKGLMHDLLTGKVRIRL